MAINGSSGAKLYICATQNPTAADKSQYAALTWVEVGEIESIGAFGDKASSVNFTSLSDARVRKLKGPRDAGNCQVVFAHDPSDTGQAALKAAEATNSSYAFKITVPDAISASHTDTAEYFQAKVMGVQLNIAAATNVTKRTLDLEIDTAIVEDLTS